jgi:hypothetical protein
MKKYLTAAAGLTAGAMLLMASPAMARVDVDVNLGVPGVYAAPAPVYVQPRPVYVEPRPVYVEPRPVYGGWHERRWHEGWRRDADGDGVPNRFDHHPYNRYRF